MNKFMEYFEVFGFSLLFVVSFVFIARMAM